MSAIKHTRLLFRVKRTYSSALSKLMRSAINIHHSTVVVCYNVRIYAAMKYTYNTSDLYHVNILPWVALLRFKKKKNTHPSKITVTYIEYSFLPGCGHVKKRNCFNGFFFIHQKLPIANDTTLLILAFSSLPSALCHTVVLLLNIQIVIRMRKYIYLDRYICKLIL